MMKIINNIYFKDTNMICTNCSGDGWIIEPAHHPECDDSCYICPIPIQVICSMCEGTGKVEDV